MTALRLEMRGGANDVMRKTATIQGRQDDLQTMTLDGSPLALLNGSRLITVQAMATAAEQIAR